MHIEQFELYPYDSLYGHYASVCRFAQDITAYEDIDCMQPLEKWRGGEAFIADMMP